MKAKATMNIFEYASRNKLRFASARGELTTEQLWVIPLTSTDGFNLDEIARKLHRTIQDLSEDSFVTTNENQTKGMYEVKLSIVKHVIAYRLAAVAQRDAEFKRVEQRRKIIEALASREQKDLEGKTSEELIKELGELDG